MDIENIKNQVEKLTQEINQHNYNYYVLDKPIISDYEFDILLTQLIELENQYPQLKLEDSPTQRVGGAITKNFETAEHKFPMLSLSNTYNEGEIEDFHRRIKQTITDEEIEYVCELKYDGTAISIWYENGILTKAVTRGDGEKGDVVTDNIKTIKTIPLRLNGNYPKTFEVRGEVVMPHKSFEILNIERVENGEEPFANPRNAASGSLKMQDSKMVAKRKLDCHLYYVVGDNLDFKTHFESMLKAKEWGFKISENIRLCKSIAEVMEFINYWETERHNLPYDTDGAVIKLNSLSQQQALGLTSKSPRWAIAYKYKTQQVASKLLSISYQVGRTGAITPVANLEPIKLGGTIVKRASLHNSDFIENLNLLENDIVFVEKGGEIIPKIVGVDETQRVNNQNKIKFITHCPACGTKLIRNEGEAAFYCPNQYNCQPQIKGKLEHFISRKAMNIDSLGEGKIEMLFDNEVVQNIADLYNLTYDRIIGLEKVFSDNASKKSSFREKSVENILAGIENSKTQPFEKVLFGLGIRFVGETIAKKIAKSFKNIQNIRNSTYEQLIEIEDIGPQIANSIIEYFKEEKNINIIEKLKDAGLQFEIAQKQDNSNILEGKTFVVSGVFSISRDEIKERIEQNGGKNSGSISSKTDFILAGDKMGPEKRKKAEQLNIKIISEEDFWEMIK